MFISKKYYLLILCIAIFSCGKKKDSIKTFDSFEAQIIQGDTINLSLSNKVLDYTIIQDTIALVNYWNNNDQYLVDIYNIKDKKVIASIAKNGAEDGNFLSTSVQYRNTSNNYFLIYDVTKKIVTSYAIDSLLKSKNYIPSSFSLPSFSKDVGLYGNDSLVLFNSYYLEIDNKPLNKKSDSPLVFLNKKNANKDNALKLDKYYTPEYFTPNVSGATILVNPNNKDIWLVDDTFDKISIYNNKGILRKEIKGDGLNSLSYAVLESDNAVFIKDRKYYRSYYPSVSTQNHVYLLYIGVQGIDLNNTSVERPCYILKMDWDGNLKNVYKTNEYLYQISISNDEKILYGTSVDKFGESASLIKYNLN